MKRWFVVPETGVGTEDDSFRPKYSDDNRVLGMSCVEIDIPPSLNLVISGEWYIAQFEASASDLDLLASQIDAYTIAYNGDFAPREVANFLNQHFDLLIGFDDPMREELPRSPREWARAIGGEQ